MIKQTVGYCIKNSLTVEYAHPGEYQWGKKRYIFPTREAAEAERFARDLIFSTVKRVVRWVDEPVEMTETFDEADARRAAELDVSTYFVVRKTSPVSFATRELAQKWLDEQPWRAGYEVREEPTPKNKFTELDDLFGAW